MTPHRKPGFLVRLDGWAIRTLDDVAYDFQSRHGIHFMVLRVGGTILLLSVATIATILAPLPFTYKWLITGLYALLWAYLASAMIIPGIQHYRHWNDDVAQIYLIVGLKTRVQQITFRLTFLLIFFGFLILGIALSLATHGVSFNALQDMRYRLSQFVAHLFSVLVFLYWMCIIPLPPAAKRHSKQKNGLERRTQSRASAI